MLGTLRHFRSWSRPRRVMLAVGGAAVMAAGTWCARGVFIHRAIAQPAPATASTASAGPAVVKTAATTNSDYTTRVVAYIHTNQAITRHDLGEYLIPRFGAKRLPTLLNRMILDKACAERGITVTAAEIDAALAEDLKGLTMDQATFMKNVLTKYKKNLYEWKEDVIRPRLQMSRLVADRVVVTEEDLRKAFDTNYGEKVECRIIFWPPDQEQKAFDQYATLRDSEAGFADIAKKQSRSDLAATGGKIRPIARNTMEKEVEEAVFRLHPGEVTTAIKTPQGIVVLKCDKRIPADTTVNFEAVKPKLTADIRERKLQFEMAAAFQAMRQQARPQPLLQKSERALATTPPPNEVVAYLWGSTPVTREQLGEYLIARMGAEKIEFIVNRRIIEAACKAKNVAVTEEDIDRALQDDLKMVSTDKEHFEKDLLSKWSKTLYEWREDVIRPRLMLTKLCEGRVKYTEDELKQCFESHYGEQLKCRAILWPPDQAKYALAEYSRIRDSEEEFSRKAKNQPSPTLAAQGGVMPPFGHHSFGDELVERAAFQLQPGEVSALIGTPQGQLVIKLDERIPAKTTVTLDSVRAEMQKEVLARKLQLEMQVVFKELHDKATPRLLLKSATAQVDLVEETKRITSGLPPVGAAPKK